MICKKCNFNNENNAKFCSNCGSKLVGKNKINLSKSTDNKKKGKLVLEKDEPDTPNNYPIEEINFKSNNYIPNNKPQEVTDFNFNTKNTTNNNSKIFKIIIGTVALLVIIFVSKNLFTKEENISLNNNTIDPNSYNYNVDEDSNYAASSSPDIYSDYDTSSNDDYAENNLDDSSNNSIPYVNDLNTQDYLSYNSPSDFTFISTDEYSFGYPKNFFNYAEETDYGYTFSADDGASLTFTVTPRTDHIDTSTQMKELYDYYLDMLYLPETLVYKDDKNNPLKRFIINGYNDESKSTGNYYFCNIYEDKIEFFEFITPISNHSKDELSHENYILDTLYRMCSFTNSTYEPRNYKQFIANNMGNKK